MSWWFILMVHSCSFTSPNKIEYIYIYSCDFDINSNRYLKVMFQNSKKQLGTLAAPEAADFSVAHSTQVSSSCNKPFKVKTTSVGALSNSSITSTRPCSMAFTLAAEALQRLGGRLLFGEIGILTDIMHLYFKCSRNGKAIYIINSPSWNVRPSIFLRRALKCWAILGKVPLPSIHIISI